MPDAPGLTDRITDRFASELYALTSKAEAGAIGVTGETLESWNRCIWENAPSEMHALFRDRARRMLQGDLSVLPFTYPIGMASR